MPGGRHGISRVKETFGKPLAQHYVLSPFRPELQLLTVNVKNFLTSAACKTHNNILQNFVVENVRRVHAHSILLNSGVIVIASTEAACESFIEQYSVVCDRRQIALLLGTRKMPISQIESVLSDFRSGKISIIVSTSIISMGINIPNCYTIIILSMWCYYQLIQYMGRLLRGTKRN